MRRLFVFVVLASATTLLSASPITRSGAGVAATTARDQFRVDIGGGTVAGPNGSFGGVRREINWDGVPDGFSAPNNLPANFFDVNSPRGLVLSTPGTGFQVSSTAASGTPVRFGNIDPQYTTEFVAFSPERLFTPLGSAVTDITFHIPGTTTPASVSAFGAMFTDNSSVVIQLFGPSGEDFGSLSPPPADNSISFAGISGLPGISRVRIIGTTPLGAGVHDGPCFPPCSVIDPLAMDDFIYAEPAVAAASVTPVPTLSPAAAMLFALLVAVAGAIALCRV